MCKILEIPRSTYYYHINTPKIKIIDTKLENLVIEIFEESKGNYGTRKIKHHLKKRGSQVSRKKIGKVIKKYGLVSKYTVKQLKYFIQIGE
ncbi:MAG: IS3 family transposase [Fusobacteriota bacterium]